MHPTWEILRSYQKFFYREVLNSAYTNLKRVLKWIDIILPLLYETLVFDSFLYFFYFLFRRYVSEAMKHFGNFNFSLGLKSEAVRMIEDVCLKNRSQTALSKLNGIYILLLRLDRFFHKKNVSNENVRSRQLKRGCLQQTPVSPGSNLA